MNKRVRKGMWFIRVFTLVLAVFFNAQYQVNAQSGTTVTGTVTGETNAPLAGVSVQVKGTTRGTTTDAQGAFSIQAASSDVLVISYVGYTAQEVTVGSQTTISVKLSTSGQELQSVVVVGYGTQRKIDVTGSVAQVSGAEVNKQPTPNPISALQGKVAGVQITNSG